MPTRPLPAGPLVPVEGAQLQRRLTIRYAVAVSDDVDPYALADEVLVPLRVAGADGPRRGATAVGGKAATVDLPAVGSGLTVTGAEVSAVVQEGDELLVRVFNPAAKASTVTIDGRRGGGSSVCGGGRWRRSRSFELPSYGIATAALTDA